MRTLLQILIDANSVLDLNAIAPTGTELLTRSNYADQAVWDASGAGQLKEFKQEFTTTTSTLATISLPTNFREFQGWPQVQIGGTWTGYEPIMAEDKYDKGQDDKYCYVLGNPAEGYKAIFNNLEVGCPLSIIYQRFPSGLLTLTAVCELSDPTYVTSKIESYVLYSRSDDRFPTAEARANQKLSAMVGKEAKGPGGLGRTTPQNFRNPLSNG
jgi:hypothetical protein